MTQTPIDYADVARQMQYYFVSVVYGDQTSVYIPGVNDDRFYALLEKHASRLNYVFDEKIAEDFVLYLTSLGVQNYRKLTIGQWMGVLAAYWGEISLDALYDRRHKHRPDPEYLVEDLINALDYVRDRGLTWVDFGDPDISTAARKLQDIARKDGVAISDYWAGIAAEAWREKAQGKA